MRRLLSSGIQKACGGEGILWRTFRSDVTSGVMSTDSPGEADYSWRGVLLEHSVAICTRDLHITNSVPQRSRISVDDSLGDWELDMDARVNLSNDPSSRLPD
jgi:hypothetical protein